MEFSGEPPRIRTMSSPTANVGPGSSQLNNCTGTYTTGTCRTRKCETTDAGPAREPWNS